MSWIDVEVLLVSLGALLSPTTLTFSVLALVLAERPLRTGTWFYIGALGATLGVGVAAAFLLGDTAASHTSSPKTWVAVFDVVAAVLILVYVTRTRTKPIPPEKVDRMVAQMEKVTASPAMVIVGAGAVLANPGGFIPLALKAISEEGPSASQYVAAWVFFALVSLLPLAAALLALLVARSRAERLLRNARDWLILNTRTVAAVILVVLAAALLRNGISGLAA